MNDTNSRRSKCVLEEPEIRLLTHFFELMAMYFRTGPDHYHERSPLIQTLAQKARDLQESFASKRPSS
jgi:hypothetical protein